MLSQILIFLLDTLLGLFSLALLLRFFMQLLRAPYRNPLSQFLVALTDILGSEAAAIRAAGKVLATCGEVIPVTTDNAHLEAEEMKLYYIFKNIEVLHAQGNEIENLEVIKPFLKLKALNISNNSLILKGIENFKALEYLDISRNGITDYSPLIQLPNLKKLVVNCQEVKEFEDLKALLPMVAIIDLNKVIETRKVAKDGQSTKDSLSQNNKMEKKDSFHS